MEFFQSVHLPFKGTGEVSATTAMNKPDFLLTPRELYEDKRVNPMDEKVYAVVYWYSRMKDGHCTASNTSIAEVISSSPQSVSNSLNHLEELGYIKRLYKDEDKRTRSEIIPLIAFTKITPEIHAQVYGVTPTDVSGGTPTGVQNNNTSIKNNKGEYTVALITSFKEITGENPKDDPQARLRYPRLIRQKCERLGVDPPAALAWLWNLKGRKNGEYMFYYRQKNLTSLKQFYYLIDRYAEHLKEKEVSEKVGELRKNFTFKKIEHDPD